VVAHRPVPAGVTALIATAQQQVVNIYPDFLPLSAMGVLRSHYTSLKIGPINGTGGACNTGESGGDVGGAVISIQGDQDYCAATGIKTGRVGLKQ
jgi:hypothetical protein